jgi:circadian clock protein KaiB
VTNKRVNLHDKYEEYAKDLGSDKYILKLYVSGMTPNSKRSIENIKRICEEHLKGNYELEIIDLYLHPEKAKEAQLIAAPTLIKKLPLPLRKIVGNMSDKEKVLKGLDIQIR